MVMEHVDQSQSFGASAEPPELISRRRRLPLASGLGWFSVGLGLTALAAPRAFARMIGVSPNADTRHVVIAVGLRELASGVGILTQRRPASMLWGRVAGDMMDLALLGNAARASDANRPRLAIAAAAVAGVAVLDVVGAQRETQRKTLGAYEETGVRVVRAITIRRSAEELYAYWRDVSNLPRLMTHLESVELVDERRSHWTAKAPGGVKVGWDAEIVEDRPNELISWRSLPGATVPNSGNVRFLTAPGDRGTEVRVELHYRLPGGKATGLLAKLFRRAPEQQVQEDLRAFKQTMELGEVVHSDASIHNGPHPGQPSTDAQRRTR